LSFVLSTVSCLLCLIVFSNQSSVLPHSIFVLPCCSVSCSCFLFINQSVLLWHIFVLSCFCLALSCFCLALSCCILYLHLALPHLIVSCLVVSFDLPCSFHIFVLSFSHLSCLVITWGHVGSPSRKKRRQTKQKIQVIGILLSVVILILWFFSLGLVLPLTKTFGIFVFVFRFALLVFVFAIAFVFIFCFA
jgi:hypothetical protein